VGHIGGLCRVVVDGTDYEVQEPHPFDRTYYSHKFRHAGLRYELATAIQTGWLVWTAGPYRCGCFPDRTIARLAGGLHDHLDPTERYIADSGYIDGGKFAFTPNGLNDADQRLQTVLRARHETVNGRLKRFRILRNTFRHDLNLHRGVFLAIANIVQLEMELEYPVFAL
jgi:hypothetical protein